VLHPRGYDRPRRDHHHGQWGRRGLREHERHNGRRDRRR
jgi:hypothetical protein